MEDIAFLKQNKEFSQKVLAKYLRTSDPEDLEGAYTIFKQDFIAAPYPITSGLEAVYDIVAFRRPEIRSRQPEEFVDTSFVGVGQKRIYQETVRAKVSNSSSAFAADLF